MIVSLHPFHLCNLGSKKITGHIIKGKLELFFDGENDMDKELSI